MSLEERVSVKNIFWSTRIGKGRERKMNHFSHCPLELPANQHSQSSPDGLIGCAGWLAGGSKGQCG